jgi:hypothetical protein
MERIMMAIRNYTRVEFENCYDAQADQNRTRTNTNPNGTEANAAGRCERACAARESKRKDNKFCH